MPKENFPPPPPTFLLVTYPVIVSSIYLASCFLNVTQDSIPCVLPPPTFLVFSLNALVLLLSALSFPVVRNRNTPLIRTLFPNFHGRRSRGRDVWQALQLNPVIFWYMTGETPETLEVVVAKIYGEVTLPRHWPRTPRTDRRRRCILDVRNRVLLVFIWLRQYLKLHVLAYIFCISKSTVAEEIYHVVPILFTNYRRFIKWHSIRRWNQFLDTFPSFPNAVGMIDGTIHRIRRPSGPLQAEFYRGDKRCHFISSQIVVDADGLIVLLVTGYSINRLLWTKLFLAWTTTTIVPYRFPGHMNDAQCYRSLPQVGHGRARDLPRRARILADGGYAARVPVITPRRIARNRRQLRANRALRSLRMQIEHSIGFQKVYASINSIFRHKRSFLPFVVCTCGFLSNRRKLIIRRLRRL